MENKDLILKGVEETLKEFTNPMPVFSEEDYKEFKAAGLTAEEIVGLERAEALSQIIDVLPENAEDIDKLLNSINSLSNDSAKINLNNLLTIAQKDPKLLVQLFAITAIAENENKE